MVQDIIFIVYIGFKSNQKVVDYSHNSFVTIV